MTERGEVLLGLYSQGPQRGLGPAWQALVRVVVVAAGGGGGGTPAWKKRRLRAARVRRRRRRREGEGGGSGALPRRLRWLHRTG